MNVSISTIASLLPLTSVSRITTPDLNIDTLLIDSRSLSRPETTLFFAIPTEGNDGHRYMRQLYDRGVRAFVCNFIPRDLKEVDDACFLTVDDTTAALQNIGAYVRGLFHGKLLSITGSRGKTTLKEWIFQLMQPLEEIVRSPRSYNSQLGVPLSLFELRGDTTLGIIEAGVSRAGEMKTLAECIQPDTVIITNIGDEHADGFHDLREKCREKLLLATGDNVSLIIFHADDRLVADTLQTLPHTPGTRLYGWSEKDMNAPLYINRRTDADGSSLLDYTVNPSGDKGTIRIPGHSDADVENAANALAFMLESGVARKVIAARFASLLPIDTRIDIIEGVNDSPVVYDSYTSDLSSLPSAIDFMNRRTSPGMPKTVILSDPMHERDDEEETYIRIADILNRNGVSRIIGIGEGFTRHSGNFTSDPNIVSEFYLNTDEFLSKRSTSDFSHEIILLKGAPEFGFQRILDILEARKHETVLEVNLDSLKKNFNYFRSFLPEGTGLIAMVKASAYGAGSYEVAKTMQDCGAAYLAVAVLDEGIELRKQGITMPIMVMNPKVVNYKSMFANRLEPEIYSMEMLADVIREAEKNGITHYPVHIKLDTGMHRMGFVEEELEKLMDILEGQDRIEARSVFSHLATADCPDMNDYTTLQLERFRRYTDYMLSRSSHRILRHILNSAGIVRFPEHHYDMARLGIGLYGVNTLPPDMERPLDTVSTLRTVIIAIREWKAGETIGYGRKGVLSRDSRIATIPIGYADGMNRHFGNGHITVKVNGHDAPTIGNICMDACMIDVTGIPCQTGDTVEIFGTSAPIYRLSDVLDTIPYEVLTSVSPRVKRVYYRE